MSSPSWRPSSDTMKECVEIFATLGTRLAAFGHTERDKAIIASAIEQNGWFTSEDILRAVEAIRLEMLDSEKLTLWLSRYTPTTHPQRVAIIMAGNIPLVGFFDLLCTLCSGHHAYIKPSSKDRVLMEYIVEELRAIDCDIPIYKYNPEERYDIAIATGGEQANDYFRRHFAGTRHLLRGSRHSVAVLDGGESQEELCGLVADITSYSGLGCRSVSMLFIPEGYTLRLPHSTPHNPKLRNTIRSRRALLMMQQRNFEEYGAFLALRSAEFPESLAEVSIQTYNTIADVETWLAEHRDQLQCVVSHTNLRGATTNVIPFGRAQYPTLYDYADGVDTMALLT